MNHADMLQLIYDYIDTRIDLPEVFYPNISYTTIPAEYLKVNVMPATPITVGINSVTWYQGIIQITVVTNDQIGELPAAVIAQKVMVNFKRGTIISDKIRIDANPYATAGMNDGAGHYQMPVTIPYNILCS